LFDNFPGDITGGLLLRYQVQHSVQPIATSLEMERQGSTPDLFLDAIIYQTAMACLVHCSRSCGSLGTNGLPALA
jgi:hypothetical protein